LLSFYNVFYLTDLNLKKRLFSHFNVFILDKNSLFFNSFQVQILEILLSVALK